MEPNNPAQKPAPLLQVIGRLTAAALTAGLLSTGIDVIDVDSLEVLR